MLRESPGSSLQTRVLAGALLFGVNLAVVWRLLFTEYLANFGSLEPVFFALARAIRVRWPDSGWWPYWNLGYPFDYTYQPLLHHVVAAASAFTGASEARVFHVLVALCYALGPVSLYALLLRWTRSTALSLAGGLLYSTVPLMTLLDPSVAAGIGGFSRMGRLHSAIFYGNGPNVAGLMLLPVALLFFDRAREHRTHLAWLAGAVALASVPLTNVPAAIGLGMAMVAYGLAAGGWRVWRDIGFSSAGAFLLFAPWLPPSAFSLMFENTQKWMDLSARFGWNATPKYLLCAAALLAVRWLLRRTNFPLRFATLFALLAGWVALAGTRFDVHLIAQPHRFLQVMELAGIMAIALAVASVAWTRKTATLAWAVGGAVAAVQLVSLVTVAAEWIRPATITERPEFRIAEWMRENAGGGRVLVEGSISSWLNYLADVPQVFGCCDQNHLIATVPLAQYMWVFDEATGDRAADVSLAWMQVFGVQYVAVNGPASLEPYHSFQHPKKFEGVLEEKWRSGDDVIYRVPQASASLAHIVRPEEVVPREPANGIDLAPMEPYRHALLDASRPQAEFTWLGVRDAVVRGRIPAGYVFSLQVPYHAGWRAEGDVRIGRDGLGFMTLAPRCEGECEVRLHFDGGWEPKVLRAASGAAWLGMAIWAWRRRRIIRGTK